MNQNSIDLKLLLVDDEDDFRRAASRTLGRRGFTVTEAASGERALEAIRRERPDVVLLDLRMPEMSGIETLHRIREIDDALPVIILTGHGDFDAAMAGIKLQVVDFLQKPIDVDQLAARIRPLLERGRAVPLRERTIRELMLPPSHYPRVYDDQPVTVALETLQRAFYKPVVQGGEPGQVRSALVYNRTEVFVGVLRFADLLKLVLPPFLEKSPYATFFTGMFLAQIKVIANRRIQDLLGERVSVDADAPIMEAVHLMVSHQVINLPVMQGDQLIGVLRERDIILEIARSVESSGEHA